MTGTPAALLAVIVLAVPLSARAQAASEAVRGVAPASVRAAAADTGRVDRRPLFTYRDAVVGAAFVGATVAMAPLDRRIAQHLQTPGAQANRFIHHGATGLELLTSPGVYVVGAGMYVVGRVGHHRRLTELAVHTGEAVLVGDALTGVLKGAAGRARPYVTGDSSARDFKFGRGFTGGEGYTSFPSGHTTTAFAAAAAVTSEMAGWYPRSRWVVGPLLYGGATAVGLSRMYHNKHWASDVVLGAGIGTFSGLKVVQFNHTHAGNRLDRILMGTSVGPSGTGGAALSWNVPMR